MQGHAPSLHILESEEQIIVYGPAPRGSSVGQRRVAAMPVPGTL